MLFTAMAVIAGTVTAVMPAGPATAATSIVAYIANSSAGTVSVLDTATDAVTGTITVGSGMQDLQLTAEGAHIFTLRSGNSLSVIDTMTTAVTTFPVTPRSGRFAVSPDGTRAYVVSTVGFNESSVVTVYDTATQAAITTFPIAFTDGGTLTPDGAELWISQDGFVDVYDTATFSLIATIDGPHTDRIEFTADGTRAIGMCGCYDHVYVIDVAAHTMTDDISMGIGTGDDNLTDTSGDDTMKSSNGNDTINVQDGLGGDTADGGNGTDTCTTDATDTKISC